MLTYFAGPGLVLAPSFLLLASTRCRLVRFVCRSTWRAWRQGCFPLSLNPCLFCGSFGKGSRLGRPLSPKWGARIRVSVHHHVLGLLLQGVPLLLQLCNDFSLGYKQIRAVALHLTIRAPIRNTIAQSANAAINELLHLHWNERISSFSCSKKADKPNPNFNPSYFLIGSTEWAN